MLSSAVRSLRALWAAVTLGGLSALAVLTVLAVSAESHPMAAHADTAFYVCALYSALALVVAFALLARMRSRLAEAPSEAAALATARMHGVAALAAAESSAILAGVVVFLTGNVLAAAYAVPFLAFAAITWPTESRVASWLAVRR
ncbi:MAG TPA: hypothetical protein VF594_08030 [Rubricoccaceae bacterium]|jgi:hypothetical protein